MRSIVGIVLLSALSFLARADTEAVPAGGLEEFAIAFGLPEDTPIAALKAHLEESWIGATKHEMRVSLNLIIRARGSLGAIKNARESFLALSSSTRSLVVNAAYDESGKVVSVKCSVRMMEKKAAEPGATDNPGGAQ